MLRMAIAYSMLLVADGVLSIVDNAAQVRTHHFSTWSTLSLCLLSLPVFMGAIIVSIVRRSRDGWPLLLSSGAYSGMLVAVFVVVLGMFLVKGTFMSTSSMASATTWRTVSVVAGVVQVILGGVCIAGALGRLRRKSRESMAA